MSDDMIFDDPMVCTADDPDPFGTEETGVWEVPNEGGIGPGADETGIWELPDEGGIGPGPDETGIWELPDSPSVEVDWDEVDPGTEVVDPPTNPGFDPEPTVPDAPQHPALPEEHLAAPGGGDFDYYPEEPQFPELGIPSDPVEIPIDVPLDELPTGDFEIPEFPPDFFIP